MQVNAYILAGGASSRMGSDKGLLLLNGESLIERAQSLLSPISSALKLVGGHAHLQRFGAVIQDHFPGCGPLAGIHAGLIDSTTEWNLIFAVDQICATPALLRLLVERAASAPHDCLAIIPEIESRPQPLCALYRKPFAELAEQALIVPDPDKDLKIDRLFTAARALLLQEKDYRTAGITPEILNLNTPQEFSAAKRKLEAAKP